MSKFNAKFLGDLTPYQWGLQLNDKKYIKLNTNENPYVIDIDIQKKDFNLYPDPTNKELIDCLCKTYQVSNDQIFIGNGSDDVIAHCLRAFFDENDSILISDITYSLYPIVAKLYKIKIKSSEMLPNLQINVKDFKNSDCNMVIVNPNATTGLSLRKEEIIDILENNKDRLIIVDEAYAAFNDYSMVDYIDKYDNLIVIQTMSKAYSLANLRIGMAFGNKSLIEAMLMVRDCINPYNISGFSSYYAKKVFENSDEVQNNINKIIDVREMFKNKLKLLKFNVFDSKGNFVLINDNELDCYKLYEMLLEKKIITRYFNFEKYNDYLRISIGTKDDMDKVVEILEKVRSGEIG